MGDSSPTIAAVVGAVVGGVVCVMTVLLLLLIIIILVHKKKARPIENEKEDPFYDYVVPPPHMPVIPLSGNGVQLKENTAYNTTEAVTSPQVEHNIAYGTIFN